VRRIWEHEDAGSAAEVIEGLIARITGPHAF
jgi:hypothetical protein